MSTLLISSINLMVKGIASGFILTMFTLTVVNAQSRPRLQVSVFNYSGPQTSFEQFSGIIRDKIITLSEEVTGRNPDSSYLRGLRLIFTHHEPHPTLEQIHTFWKETDSLALLQGTIFSSNQDPNPSVKSRIYLGDLYSKSLALTLLVNQNEFANTADSHSLALLYALAMDAKQAGRSPAVIAALLQHAQNKLADLERRGPFPAELTELKMAIENAAVALRSK